MEMIYEAIVLGFDKFLNPDDYKKGGPKYEAEVALQASNVKELMDLASEGEDGNDGRVEQLRRNLVNRSSDVGMFWDVMQRLGIKPDNAAAADAATQHGPGGTTYMDPFEYTKQLQNQAERAIDKIILQVDVADSTKGGVNVNAEPAPGSRPPDVKKRVGN